jgi:hypothetical protein
MMGLIMKYFSLRRIPTAVWVLGFVSLLMDISSEMIHSLLPLFMVTTLKTVESKVVMINSKVIKGLGSNPRPL